MAREYSIARELRRFMVKNPGRFAWPPTRSKDMSDVPIADRLGEIAGRCSIEEDRQVLVYAASMIRNWEHAKCALDVARGNGATVHPRVAAIKTPPGLDEDGMCNDHGAFMCKRCCPVVTGEN